MSAPIIPGAEPMSHEGNRHAGVLVLHGFTGNPGSMRGLAEACSGAGFHVEMPRLAGHGTTVEEMIPTRWADWTRDVEDAYQRLARRTDRIVVMGLSMGGSLTLWTALEHPEVRGIVCINPATRPQAPEVMEMIRGMLASGTETYESIGSDIADPDSTEKAYDATPLAPLLSFQTDGLADISTRYSNLGMPLLLFTSVNDHVVSPEDSDHLASVHGGHVEHVRLERSFHVATQDYDKQTIFDKSVEFAARVTS